MLCAEHLGVRLGDAHVLRDISLCIEPGTFNVILGPNGAGKTTLLRCLSGELAVETGAVTLHGKPLNRWPGESLARYRAVVPQNLPSRLLYRVCDVVSMGRYPHHGGFPGTRDRAIAWDAMRWVDVETLADRQCLSLSGGQLARVMLARAFAQIWEPQPDGPRCLLLDEPTASLDPAYQHRALATVKRLTHSEGLSTVAIVHDLNLAAQYADQIVLLSDGGVLTRGAPHQVLTPQVLRAAYRIDAVVMRHPLLPPPIVQVVTLGDSGPVAARIG